MLAQDLIDLHASPRQAPPFSERYPGLTAGDAYTAAAALHGHRLAQGWRPVGRKIGFTNRTIWPRYGVHEPIWGTVYDRTLVQAPAGRAEVSLAGLLQPRIEPEICFGMLRAPDPAGGVEDLLDAIEWIAHSLEIVQCRHPGWKLTLADAAADNGLHGRLVLGEKIPVRALRGLAQALPKVQVALLRGTEIADRGVGSNVLDSPLLALAHLVALLARQSGAPALAAGELVSTGTLTDAHPVVRGEAWRTVFTGLSLPGLEVQFL